MQVATSSSLVTSQMISSCADSKGLSTQTHTQELFPSPQACPRRVRVGEGSALVMDVKSTIPSYNRPWLRSPHVMACDG